MHKKFRDLASQYEITEETSKQILAELKIKKLDKNPSQLQLQGFKLVCNLVKEGTDLVEAVARVEESWQQCENQGQIAETAVKIVVSSSNGHHPQTQSNGNEMAVTKEIANISFNEIKLINLTKSSPTPPEKGGVPMTEINFDEEEF